MNYKVVALCSEKRVNSFQNAMMFLFERTHWNFFLHILVKSEMDKNIRETSGFLQEFGNYLSKADLKKIGHKFGWRMFFSLPANMQTYDNYCLFSQSIACFADAGEYILQGAKLFSENSYKVLVINGKISKDKEEREKDYVNDILAFPILLEDLYRFIDNTADLVSIANSTIHYSSSNMPDDISLMYRKEAFINRLKQFTYEEKLQVINTVILSEKDFSLIDKSSKIKDQFIIITEVFAGVEEFFRFMNDLLDDVQKMDFELLEFLLFEAVKKFKLHRERILFVLNKFQNNFDVISKNYNDNSQKMLRLKDRMMNELEGG